MELDVDLGVVKLLVISGWEMDKDKVFELYVDYYFYYIDIMEFFFIENSLVWIKFCDNIEVLC